MPIKLVGPDRSRMLAEQMVTKLSQKLRWGMNAAVREQLTQALIKSDAASDLMFRNKPYQPKTPWTISGLLARITLAYQNKFNARARFDVDENDDDPAARLATTHYKVKGSGAVGLTIALLIALFVGMSGILQPLETGLQIGRDAARRHAASGDIGVHVTEVQKVPLSKSLILLGNFDFLLQKWRICVGLRFFTVLA